MASAIRTELLTVALVGACTEPQGTTAPLAAAPSNQRFIGAMIPHHPDAVGSAGAAW